uniref:Uncharacterized protein n=1 Tax=Oreochromis aureus TaxID=47969 RepID=A0A668RVD6_OREAU
MLFLWTLALFAAINTVTSVGATSTPKTYVGYKDDWILLPCVSLEPAASESLNIFWRDKDDKVVLDVINGKTDKIDPFFTNRVVSFPDEYKKGNFSIVIRQLKFLDTGPYDCEVPQMSFQIRLFLRVVDRIPTPCANATKKANATGKPVLAVTEGANGVGRYTQSVTMLSICLAIFFLFYNSSI